MHVQEQNKASHTKNKKRVYQAHTHTSKKEFQLKRCGLLALHKIFKAMQSVIVLTPAFSSPSRLHVVRNKASKMSTTCLFLGPLSLGDKNDGDLNCKEIVRIRIGRGCCYPAHLLASRPGEKDCFPDCPTSHNVLLDQRPPTSSSSQF